MQGQNWFLGFDGACKFGQLASRLEGVDHDTHSETEWGYVTCLQVCVWGELSKLMVPPFLYNQFLQLT